MHVFLGAESEAGGFEFDAEAHVEVFVLGGGSLVVVAFFVGVAGVVGVLDIFAGVGRVEGRVDAHAYKLGCKFVERVEPASQVDHRPCLATHVDHEERGYVGRLGNLGVVGTESRRDMHDAGTVVGGNVVARDYTEGCVGDFDEAVHADGEYFFGMLGGIFCRVFRGEVSELAARFYPRHELLVAHTDQFGAGVVAHDAVGHDFVAYFVVFEWCRFAFFLEI